MGHQRTLSSFLALCLLPAGAVAAQIEFITQRHILSEPLIAPIAAIDFFAQVDLSTISGTGDEFAVITLASIRYLERADVDSEFFIAAAGNLNTPADPYAEVPLNLRARFMDGVFTNEVSVISNPASGGLDLIGVGPGNSGGLFTTRPGGVIHGFSVLNLNRYALSSSTITPSPSTAALLGLACLSRRRRAAA
ncbi:MAG: hypothetical protein AAGB51_01765 [Planctomycetota bacterium]